MTLTLTLTPTLLMTFDSYSSSDIPMKSNVMSSPVHSNHYSVPNSRSSEVTEVILYDNVALCRH